MPIYRPVVRLDSLERDEQRARADDVGSIVPVAGATGGYRVTSVYLPHVPDRPAERLETPVSGGGKAGLAPAGSSAVQWQKLHGGLGEYYAGAAAMTTAAHDPDAAPLVPTSLHASVYGANGRIAIDAAAGDGNGATLLRALEALGLEHGAAFGALVSGYLPGDRIDDAANLSELRFARPAYVGSYSGGAYSQGDAAMRADDARASYTVDGTGITVGVLSDSFDTLGGYAADVASGDLPAGVVNLQNGSGSSDEGRAMAQIVHDVAPGASIAFHTAWEGQANFAQGILDLSAISQVIVDDVFYFAEPFFQDGIIAQAVDAAVASGDVYFSAAGNQASRSYESPFVDSGVVATIRGAQYRLHDFDPGAGVDTRQRVTQSGDVSYILQWDQPFYSQSPGSGGSASDVDFFLFNTNGTLVASSIDDNIGADPFEYFRRSASGSYELVIGLYGGGAPALLKYATAGGTFTIDEYATASGTNTGHANAAGAIAVGAAAFYNTPEYGAATPVAESYSSAGGVPILFDRNGVRLTTPVVRDKTEITAPDGGNTTFFGSDSSRDADSLPNFFGTSAAAPHAAALAALMLDLAPTARPAQIEQALKDSAIDMGAAGFDRVTGYGLIQAPAALHAIASMTTVNHAPAINSAGGGDSAEIGVAENSAAVVNVTATDPDPGQTLTYAIAGGADAARFSIDASTGGLAFIAAPDFESPADAGGNNVYDLTVVVRDSAGATDTQAIAVRVVDLPGATISGSSSADSLTGTLEADAVSGLAGDDTIGGGGGNDTIDGGTGGDTMVGGPGNDFYFIDNVWDGVLENAGEGIDTVFSAVNLRLGANIENGTLAGAAATLTGNGADNVLTGNDLANTIDGLAGGDTMIGRGGDDTYILDNVWDGVLEDAGGGNDLIISAVNLRLGANIENGALAGSARSLIGNALDNRLSGTSGADFLDGLGGQDLMIGGAGDDSYVIDNVWDGVLENAGEGTDTITSSVNLRLGANIENGALAGAANSLIGNALDNRLSGTSGADFIDGAGGQDLMIGGPGDDTYVIDNVWDGVLENAGEGTDTINSAVNLRLGASIENGTLIGSAISLFGNGAANRLIGNGLANLIDGAAGNDTLTGGGGADTFDFNALGQGVDTITDFTRGSGGDRLDLRDVVAGYNSGSAMGNFVRLTESGGNTTVAVNADGAGSDFVDVAVLQSATGLLLNDMLAQGNLLVA